MHVVKKDGETQFALTEELVLHFAASIFGKETIQEKCLFRVTRNADIDVKEGMMDHDIDYREIMTELLKRRRKLAAVRLQITPAPAPEVERLLCNRLLLTHKRVFEQKSPLDLSFFLQAHRPHGSGGAAGTVLPGCTAHAAAAGLRPCR